MNIDNNNSSLYKSHEKFMDVEAHSVKQLFLLIPLSYIFMDIYSTGEVGGEQSDGTTCCDRGPQSC